MLFLKNSLDAWGTVNFERTFQAEVERLPIEQLPLQAGLRRSSAVADEPFKVVVLGMEALPQALRVKTGIFYSGVVAGCSCADDPTPVETEQEYCELEFLIERSTASTRVHLVAEE